MKRAILIVGLSSAIGTYPSGHATDEVRSTTSGAARSFRSDRSPDRERVYINLICPESVVRDNKKTESGSESDMFGMIAELEDRVSNVERMLEVLLQEIVAIREGDNTGFKHQNDGGWFD